MLIGKKVKEIWADSSAFKRNSYILLQVCHKTKVKIFQVPFCLPPKYKVQKFQVFQKTVDNKQK